MGKKVSVLVLQEIGSYQQEPKFSNSFVLESSFSSGQELLVEIRSFRVNVQSGEVLVPVYSEKDKVTPIAWMRYLDLIGDRMRIIFSGPVCFLCIRETPGYFLIAGGKEISPSLPVRCGQTIKVNPQEVKGFMNSCGGFILGLEILWSDSWTSYKESPLGVIPFELLRTNFIILW